VKVRKSRKATREEKAAYREGYIAGWYDTVMRFVLISQKYPSSKNPWKLIRRVEKVLRNVGPKGSV